MIHPFCYARVVPGLLIIFSLSELNAQLLPFTDDFQDGDATDGSPVTWREQAEGGLPGIREVQDGDYIQQGPGYFGSYVNESSVPPFGPIGDVSIRTQLRVIDTDNSWVFSSLAAGGGTNDQGNVQLLWGGIRENGGLFLGEFFEGANVTHVSTELGFTPVDVDVHLQLDVRNNTLSLTAWADGSPKPESPQLVHARTTPPPSPGAFGFFTNSNENNTPRVAFRSFSAVPEPTTSTLLLLGMPLIMGNRWRRKRTRFGCDQNIVAWAHGPCKKRRKAGLSPARRVHFP